jgi:hypothetical protein
VHLPFGDGHDLGQRRAFGQLHHRDYFSLLVGAVRFGLTGWLPARPAFFAGLAFLAVARFVFGCGTSGADAFFSDSVVVFIRFS